MSDQKFFLDGIDPAAGYTFSGTVAGESFTDKNWADACAEVDDWNATFSNQFSTPESGGLLTMCFFIPNGTGIGNITVDKNDGGTPVVITPTEYTEKRPTRQQPGS